MPIKSKKVSKLNCPASGLAAALVSNNSEIITWKIETGLKSLVSQVAPAENTGHKTKEPYFFLLRALKNQDTPFPHFRYSIIAIR